MTILVVLLPLVGFASVADPPVAPPPDAAALARLPAEPDALPGLAALGPCPPGRAPGGVLDTLDPGAPTAAAPDAGAGQLVAVVDSGVAAHPRLGGRVVDGGDFVAGRSGLDDCDGHGTAVAGLLAAAPSPSDLFGGTAPGARVLAVRAFSAWSAAGGQRSAGDVATLARAVRRAASTPGVGVLTLALAACRSVADPVDPALGALRAAVRDAADRGVVVVAAAGNATGNATGNADGDCGPARPVPVPGWFDDDVLTVGAVSDPASLPGPWVDVAADGRTPVSLDARSPGLTTALTLPGRSPAPVEGTSVATARVAAVAALLRAHFPALGAREIAARIARTAAPVPGQAAGARDPVVGFGVVDPAAALAGARPAPAPEPGDDGGPVTAVVAVSCVVGVLVGGAAGVLAVRGRRTRRGVSRPRGRGDPVPRGQRCVIADHDDARDTR